MRYGKRLRRVERRVDAISSTPRPVTYRTIEVNFPNKTVTLDGATHQIEADVVVFPILDTDTMVFPRGGGQW